MDDLISRQALMKEFSDFVRASNNSDFARTPTWNDAVSLVGSMPSAQPELIEQGAYMRGFEQGRTQGMIDAQGEPMGTIKAEWTNADALNLQPTCNQLATDCIDRQAAIDAVESMLRRKFGIGGDLAEITLAGLPSAQPEIEERKEESAQNVSKEDLISRKAAIDAIGSYILSFTAIDRNYYEGLRDAKRLLHSMPSAQPDIIACGDCKHWICHDRRCGFWNHGVKPLDWCCHAERRTDEAD